MGPFQRAGRETRTHSGNETWQVGNGSRQQHGILFFYGSSQSIPGDTVVKNLPASAGGARDAGSIPGLGRSPGVGNGKPTPVFLLKKFHGQKSLAGYGPWKSQRVRHNMNHPSVLQYEGFHHYFTEFK